MLRYLKEKRGCPTFIEFDDEEYLHDGMNYPVPVKKNG